MTLLSTNKPLLGKQYAFSAALNCFSEHHTSADCPKFMTNPSTPPVHQSQSGLNYSVNSGAVSSRPFRERRQDICQNFNQIRCRSRKCKYHHTCNICQLPHPEVDCPSRPPTSAPGIGNKQSVQNRYRTSSAKPSNTSITPTHPTGVLMV